MDEEFYILDTETTGLKNAGICEIAWLKVDKDLNILEQFDSRVNPERPIEPGAQAIHGITDADVVGMPVLAEIAARITGPITIIGHNCSFDMRMISSHIEVAGSLCTLALSRRYIKQTSNHKLSTLKAELNLPDQVSHSALGDVLTVRDLLLYLLPIVGGGIPTLVTRQEKPKVVHRMPFGKYKGKLSMEVPSDYRKWLLSQDGVDKDIRYTFEKMKGVL